MAQIVKLKRSNVAGNIPPTSSIDLGELAINTADGKGYFKRSDDTIQAILTTNTATPITGSLKLAGNINVYSGSLTVFGTDNSITGTLAEPQNNNIIIDAVADGDKSFIVNDNGAHKWAIQTYRNENGRFLYVYDFESDKEPLVIENSGRIGINKQSNIMNFHSMFATSSIGGKDDLYVGGLFTGSQQVFYEVAISTAAATDKYTWRKSLDNGTTWTTSSAEVNVSLTPTNIDTLGVTVYWESTSSHNTSNKWSFHAFPQQPQGAFTVGASMIDGLNFTADCTVPEPSFVRVTYYMNTSTDSVMQGWITGSKDMALYVSVNVPLESLYFSIINPSQELTGITSLEVEYWNGVSWSPQAIISDGTALGGNSFVQSGNLLFGYPVGWSKTPPPGLHNNRYYLRVRPNSFVTALPKINAVVRNGTNRFAIYAAPFDALPTLKVDNVGRVAIGKTNGILSKLLTVSDTLNPTTSASSSGIAVDLQNGGGVYVKDNNNSIEAKFEAVGDKVSIGSMTNHPLAFVVNGVEYIRISSSGHVGIDASLAVNGDTTITGSLNVTNGITGSLFGTASFSNTASYVTPLNQDVIITGSVITNGHAIFYPIVGGHDTSISASFIFSSGSGNDLYFGHNNRGHSNITKLSWIEGNLYTGLLYGGLISTASSTTFNVSSGSGIIVSLNATLTSAPTPEVVRINWDTITNQSPTYLTSSNQTYIGIDSSGSLIQQDSPWSAIEYNTSILLGTVIHSNNTTINSSTVYPRTAYGATQQAHSFIKAFGPLKLSGYVIHTSSSLGLTIGSGSAFAEGRNYQIDPNNPSYIFGNGTDVSKIYRLYESGSTFVQNTNGGAGYTVLDPANYNNNGALTTVPSGSWTIQRIFWFPNSATKAIIAYYGNIAYASQTLAVTNLPYETFNEIPNTQNSAVYLGAILLRSDAEFTDTATYVILAGGIFRNTGGTSGGGLISVARLEDLYDVTLSSPTNAQPLAYDTGLGVWKNTSVLSASIHGTAATASYVTQLNQDVSITGSLNTSGSLTLGGTANLNGRVDVSGSMVTSGSLTTYGSFQALGTANISGSLNVSGALGVEGILSAFGKLNVSGSTVLTGSLTTLGTAEISGALNVKGLTVHSGSVVTSGSLTAYGSFYTLGTAQIQGGLDITGSLAITGSTTQVGNNTLLGNTLLSGSITISSSFPPGNPSSSVNIYGNMATDGYIRFNPVSTNINTSISASYIYVSGSTNDLYFSQNGGGYTNVTRLRWLEGNLYTGLLSGGLIATSSSTVYTVYSGSGVIVNLNASLTDDPYPTIKYLKWNTLSASIAPLSASYDQIFVGIDDTNNIIAQGTPFTSAQIDSLLRIGTVLHQNRSTINGTITSPMVGYGIRQRYADFISAFGPLKLSGFTLYPSGSLGLTLGSGTAFNDGHNYQTNPNNPSYESDPGTAVSKIFRYRQSGSSWVYDTNGGAGYTTIDPTKYSLNGTLTGVGAGEWSIQRVFWFANSPSKGLFVYYGNAKYATDTEAVAAIPFEPFVEAPNTAANAIYIGAIIINGTGVFTTPADYTIMAGGLFRQVGGSGGGGSVPSTVLSGLADVTISAPSNGQPFVYNTTLGKWTNSSALTASLSGNASTATTASFASTASFVALAQTASYVNSALTASYVKPLNQNVIVTGSVSATNLQLTGTTGTGYITLLSQSSIPTVPSANQLLLYATSSNGFTRLLQDNEATTNLVYGRDNVFIARNSSGTIISKGQVVYASGVSGSIPTIAKARANSSTTLPALGIAMDTINLGTVGQVMYSGILDFDTSAFSGSDQVWVSATTAGSLTNSRPSGSSNYVQRMGSILVSGTTGSMLVQTAPAVLNMETGTNAATWTGQAIVGTSLTINGQVSASGVTSSLFGTSSWANHATTASFITTAQTASYVATAQTASYVLHAVSSSFASTASYVNTLNQNVSVVGSLTASSVIFANNPTPGVVSAQFGTSIPFYITANWPTLGFNAYYDGGWKYGAGSANNYSAFQSIDPSSGEMNYYFSAAAGNEGNPWGGQQLVFAMYPDGRIRVPVTFTETSLVQADSSGYFSAIPITGSAYPITSSNAVTASFAQTASYVNPLNQDVIITGSLVVTGSTSSFAGSVGIGTLTSPPKTLTVSGFISGSDSISIGAGTVATGTNSSAFGSGSNASGNYSTVGGGLGSTASGRTAAVAGGRENTASGYYSAIGGGRTNTASACYTAVGGGESNTASICYATIAGGKGNIASGARSAIGGGNSNTASCIYATIAGGNTNTARSRASVGGGQSNTASGIYSTVPGGHCNVASGQASTAIGRCVTAAAPNSTAIGTGISGVSPLLNNYSSSFMVGFNSTSSLFVSSSSVGINKVSPLNAALDVNGNVIVTGSLNITAGITGSLLGTSSYASVALSASYSSTATSASYANNATSASYANNALTASYVTTAQTASFVLNAVSSSFASTASYVNRLNQNVIVTGSLVVTGSFAINTKGNSETLTITNWRGASTTLGRNIFIGGGGLSTDGTSPNGASNTSVGYEALLNNSSGYVNTAIGTVALKANLDGYFNTAVGMEALLSNTSGIYNTAVGVGASADNSLGGYNTAIGVLALNANLSYQNTAVGYNAGRYLTNGSTGNARPTSSLYLGVDTRASASSGTNEIVIGYGAIGNGSNSVTLGNTSVTKTILRANVGIGTTSPSTILHVSKNQNAATSIRVDNTTAGSTAQADFRAYNDAGDFFALGIYSSTTGTYGILGPRTAFNYGASPSGFALVADNPSAPIVFAAGGHAETMRLSPNGRISGGSNTTASGNCSIAFGNTNTASANNSAVGGGQSNTASGNYSTVSGGQSNTASGFRSTVSGGQSNTASGYYSTVGGGLSNIASCNYSTVGGGAGNTACGVGVTVGGGKANTASAYYSTVSGGTYNTASGYYSTVGGGRFNTASGNRSTVSGGYMNTASCNRSTVGGGQCNTSSNCYSTISGGQSNAASGNTSTIGGGNGNIASEYMSTVGGGLTNTASGCYSVISGGYCGRALGTYSTVSGGYKSCASADFSTVSGGKSNIASGTCSTVGGGNTNTACGGHSTVGGGYTNTASGASSTIGGGYRNIASGESSTIGGGESNTASCSWSTVGGGVSNTASSSYSTVGGGNTNTASGLYSTISGGRNNTASCNYSTVSGGQSNTASGESSTIGGGQSNTASGNRSTVSGGYNNTASGQRSTIAGGGANTASGYNSVISGGAGSTASSDYATIGGGQSQTASCLYTTIGGGQANTASGYKSTVSGGSGNTASGASSTVGGGGGNTASSYYATVSGGQSNTASGYNSTVSGGSGNIASGTRSTVGGGFSNTASNTYSTVSGGSGNIASGLRSTVSGGIGNNTSITNDCFSTVSSDYGYLAYMCPNTGTIAGGSDNCIIHSINITAGDGDNADVYAYGGSTIGGGCQNVAGLEITCWGGPVCSGFATVGGGFCNRASAFNATISGGWRNTASSYISTVGGGFFNTASGHSSTIGGGYGNTASGNRSTVSGGVGNTASNAYSTVSGGNTNTASGVSSTIGGGIYNTASSNLATVSGGFCNTASGCTSTIGGGRSNTASNYYSTVGGGQSNTASGTRSTIGGGYVNIASGTCSTVGGGASNTASACSSTVGGGRRNTASAAYATVGGGYLNTASGLRSTIGGGRSNTASNYYSTVGGGRQNTACGGYSTIGGGYVNIASGTCSTVGGGASNTASACSSTVGGGRVNTASNVYSTVGGGRLNTASGLLSTVSGGYVNTACGCYSTVGGGYLNTASGDCSSILGGYNNNTCGYTNSHIIGSGLSAGAADTTYVQALSKTSGTFRISHPDPAKSCSKYLHHSFVESPTEGDNIYRFVITTVDNKAIITLPDYFKYLNKNAQVWITPKNHFGSAYGIVDDAYDLVDIHSNIDGEYNVLIIGTRKDPDAVKSWMGTEVDK